MPADHKDTQARIKWKGQVGRPTQWEFGNPIYTLGWKTTIKMMLDPIWMIKTLRVQQWWLYFSTHCFNGGWNPRVQLSTARLPNFKQEVVRWGSKMVLKNSCSWPDPAESLDTPKQEADFSISRSVATINQVIRPYKFGLSMDFTYKFGLSMDFPPLQNLQNWI